MLAEHHLILQPVVLPSSGEWSPPPSGWVVMRVCEGMGYWMQAGTARELNSGDGLVACSEAKLKIRASQLGNLKLEYYLVQPQLLNGLLTVAEGNQLNQVAKGVLQRSVFFQADDLLGQKFARLVHTAEPASLSTRTLLVQFWAQALGGLLVPSANRDGRELDHSVRLRERFRELVSKMPEAEIATLAASDLAAKLHCSERHLTRIFKDELGVSFRTRRTELRLQQALKLLSKPDSKVVNIAYEVGYRNLGLFNLMFKKQFGTTPSGWRKKNIFPMPKPLAKRAAVSVMVGLLTWLLMCSVTPARAEDNPDQARARLALVQKMFELSDAAQSETNAAPSAVAPAGIATAATNNPVAEQPAPVPPAWLPNRVDNPAQAQARLALVQNIFESGATNANGRGVPAPVLVTATPEILAAANVAGREDTGTNAGPKLKVEKYLIEGNSLLPSKTANGVLLNVTNAFGTNVTFADVHNLLGELQMAYRERGFVTVSVKLPPQKLTNATVKVQVIEGRLSAINVKGNDHFSTENVWRALPSLHTNMMLNSHVFQRELDTANANRDRQIYPVISPGQEPGTSELTLKVKDTLPLHSRVEINNLSTPGTPESRVAYNGQYDNLWQLEHQLGVSYSFTPLDFKGGDTYKFSGIDDPLIANYGAYYRLPLGSPQAVQEEIDHSGGSFGYNEATHQFKLPPPTGRPELSFYASRSTSDTGVQRGPRGFAAYETATNSSGNIYNPLSITTNTAGQSITVNESLGMKFSMPLTLRDGIVGNVSLGLDFKRFLQTGYNTNENLFQTQYYNSLGNLVVNNANAPQALPSSHTGVDYFPLNLGFNFSKPDRWGNTMINAQLNYNLATVGSLSQLAYSSAAPMLISSNSTTHALSTNSQNHARNNYLTLQAGITREQRIYQDWKVLLHADGQWASSPLFSNEQYAMGGTAGVRGYSDGESYGDAGWRVSIEPRTPMVNIGMVDGDQPFWVRGSIFLDYGQTYRLQQIAATSGVESFLGCGTSLTANIGSHLDGRLTMALPMLASALTPAWTFHFYFGVGAQF